MFGCFLDASKAFDCVDHHALFQKLLRRNLPPVVVRLLLFWYQQQSVQVRWQSTLSEPFGVSNGVRQGGVLLPILFTVYIDDLLLDLHQLGVGCFWKQHFVGALCYADDVALFRGGVAGPAGPAKAGPLFSRSLVSFSDCRDSWRTRRMGQVSHAS